MVVHPLLTGEEGSMHPLRNHLNNLRQAAPDSATYRKSVLRLATQVGVHDKLFNNIANPKQKTSELAPLKALKLEKSTYGAVPALSVCPKLFERIDTARKILALAQDLGY